MDLYMRNVLLALDLIMLGTGFLDGR